jgi:hypothetical protein
MATVNVSSEDVQRAIKKAGSRLGQILLAEIISMEIELEAMRRRLDEGFVIPTIDEDEEPNAEAEEIEEGEANGGAS